VYHAPGTPGRQNFAAVVDVFGIVKVTTQVWFGLNGSGPYSFTVITNTRPHIGKMNVTIRPGLVMVEHEVHLSEKPPAEVWDGWNFIV
jgi:hypothetical protein